MRKVYKVICKEDKPCTTTQFEVSRIECNVTIDDETQTMHDVIKFVEEHFKVPLMIMSITDVAEELKHLDCRNR